MSLRIVPLVSLILLVMSAYADDHHISLMQIRKGYGLDAIQADGTGQTVAILIQGKVDPATVKSDLNTSIDNANKEAAKYGYKTLAPANIKVVYADGVPPDSSAKNWKVEAAIDPQMVHAVAPGAKIIMIISTSDSDSNIHALKMAVNMGATIVSMSLGQAETSCKSDYRASWDAIFAANPMITFIAGSGDSGSHPDKHGNNQVAYPAASPLVVAVGAVNEDFSANPEAWSGSGGGVSTLYPRPIWQKRLGGSGTFRILPDLSMAGGSGNPVSTIVSGVNRPSEGTSIAAPLFAGVIALANQLNGSNLGDIHRYIYAPFYRGAFLDYYRDSKTGNNGFAATPGFDMDTGLGVPKVSDLLDLLTKQIGNCEVNDSSGKNLATQNMTNGNCAKFCARKSGAKCTFDETPIN